ncbi:hypothetical protein D3C80_2079460 [compost metagenome]
MLVNGRRLKVVSPRIHRQLLRQTQLPQIRRGILRTLQYAKEHRLVLVDDFDLLGQGKVDSRGGHNQHHRQPTGLLPPAPSLAQGSQPQTQ